MFPDFIGIGAMRSGTTWLYEALNTHPDIYLARPKELHFFDRVVLSEGLNWYLEKFDGKRNKKGASIRGEITPAYSTLKKSTVVSIKALMPNLRLFLILRHPVERAFSHVLLEFGRMRGQTFAEVPVTRFLRIFERERIKRRTDYARMLRIWWGQFGKEAVYVGLYEDLQKDPLGHLQGICRHIGVNPDWQVPESILHTRVHGAQILPMPDVIRWYLSRQWLEQTREANGMLNGRLGHWIREMEEWADDSSGFWRFRSALNKGLLALPEHIGYAFYDALRDYWLQRRCAAVIAQAGSLGLVKRPAV